MTSLGEILLSSELNIALPGNWSPELFKNDLYTYPVLSKEILWTCIIESLNNSWSYLKFFEKTRGYPRECKNLEVWNIFESGQLMMLAEDLFLFLIQEDVSDKKLLNYLRQLASTPISEWDNIKDWKLFLSDPQRYLSINN